MYWSGQRTVQSKKEFFFGGGGSEFQLISPI